MLRPRFEPMRSSLKSPLVAVIAGLACMLGLLSLVGCSQSEGDECQLDSDCSSDLVCDRAKGAVRGACRNPNTLNAASDAGKADAAEPPLPEEDSGAPAGEDGGLDLGDAG
jgi:hypothetical protein